MGTAMDMERHLSMIKVSELAWFLAFCNLNALIVFHADEINNVYRSTW